MVLTTGENDKDRRLDRVLRKALPDYPLPLIHRLLRQGKVLVDGKPAKAQDRVGSGVKINIYQKISHRGIEPEVREAQRNTKKNDKYSFKTPYNLDILWQKEGLIAVNKPVGLAVHGAGSLDEMVRSFLADKLPPSLSFKSGPLHRLDKPSSGIVVFSASLEGARLFSSLLRERKVRKTYLAIVEGNAEKEEIWEDDLLRDKSKKKTFVSQKESSGSKTAFTRVIPLAAATAQGRQFTLIKAEIATGRTHQIRVQAAAHGHPLAGDRKYGGGCHSWFDSGFFLHAWRMEFLEYTIEAPLPDEFNEIIEKIFSLSFSQALLIPSSILQNRSFEGLTNKSHGAFFCH